MGTNQNITTSSVMKLSKEYFENPFAHVCSEAGVFGDTGFPRKTIDALWNKYGNLLSTPT